MITFLIPHKSLKTAALPLFKASIDDIESVTGADFLSQLPDDIETELESEVTRTMW